MSATKELTLDQLDFALGFLGEAVDFTPPLKNIRQHVMSETRDNFDKEEDPDGVPWLPLKRPRNRARDRRPGRAYGDKILNDSGRLRSSTIAAGSIGNIDTLTETSLEWGSNLEYAGIHQDGGTIHKPAQHRPPPAKPFVFPADDGTLIFTRRIRAHDVVIPARPYLGFNESDLVSVEDIVADHVERQLIARLDAL